MWGTILPLVLFHSQNRVPPEYEKKNPVALFLFKSLHSAFFLKYTAAYIKDRGVILILVLHLNFNPQTQQLLPNKKLNDELIIERLFK